MSEPDGWNLETGSKHVTWSWKKNLCFHVAVPKKAMNMAGSGGSNLKHTF